MSYMLPHLHLYCGH
ncbi:hypothetical protein E2C01_063952 [Portunus trituberculatus]|uniref:Uncharacterized protein n=1 Tax=Portunus trituberculatus TaxID=210409 RepID=A0A5B7HAH9_PORTR|nr:hypothetical protein [Portunus trituberculatus]